MQLYFQRVLIFARLLLSSKSLYNVSHNPCFQVAKLVFLTKLSDSNFFEEIVSRKSIEESPLKCVHVPRRLFIISPLWCFRKKTAHSKSVKKDSLKYIQKGEIKRKREREDTDRMKDIRKIV